MDVRFDGKIALVTGAGKGIGWGISVALARQGAKVFALSRTQDDLDALKKEVPEINPVCVDVGNWDETRKVVEQLGPIDLLVNNAGISDGASALEAAPENFDRVYSINVKAPINLIQVVAKGMVARGKGGSIVNISSQASQIALKNHLLYCSAKSALDMVTKSFALELGPHQIRVNSVLPTVVLTDLGKQHWSDEAKAKPMLERIPMHRFAEIKDVVHPVLYLLSDKADMINGAMLPVDGGALAN